MAKRKKLVIYLWKDTPVLVCSLYRSQPGACVLDKGKGSIWILHLVASLLFPRSVLSTELKGPSHSLSPLG